MGCGIQGARMAEPGSRFALLFVCFVGLAAACVGNEYIMGVPDSRRQLYPALDGTTDEEFSCIKGDGVIPAAAVNDDYCDCPEDGSDEPGTSACPGGKFYCVNRNHHGFYIPSSRVGDGVCDCCDGSDEALNLLPGGVIRCPDTCEQEGAEYRRAQSEAIRVAEAGARAKQALIAEGRAALDEVQRKLDAKREEVEAAKSRLAAAEQLVSEEEALERADQAERATSQDDVLLTSIGVACNTEDPVAEAREMRRLLVKLVERADASDALVDILNEEARAEYDAAVAAFNDAAAMTTTPPTDHNANTGTAEGAPGPEAAKQPPIPPVAITWPDTLPTGASYVRPSAKAAREELEAAEAADSALSADIGALEKQLKGDYGPDGEWWSLRSRCVETKASKYSYSVCPFKEAKQDHTRLGTWKGWEDDSHTVMVFADGARCWNGPARSLRVRVECGVEDWLGEVEEPSTCTYTARLRTPAACDVARASGIDISLGPDDVVASETASEL